jgi:hypothetical protein
MAFGLHWFIRARTESARYSCIAALKTIDGAKQTWALEFHKTTNNVPTWTDLTGGSSPILGWRPECPNGGVYTIGRIGDDPICSTGGPSHSLR